MGDINLYILFLIDPQTVFYAVYTDSLLHVMKKCVGQLCYKMLDSPLVALLGCHSSCLQSNSKTIYPLSTHEYVFICLLSQFPILVLSFPDKGRKDFIHVFPEADGDLWRGAPANQGFLQ